ncbi:hypothetical protein CTH30272_04086 [Allocatenococcus thiocycli]|nr:hypothetical protein CTH30272_04086 [Catenococcus thiocycli]
MNTVLVEKFIPKLRQLVNVSLPPLLNDALVQAAQEFCRESKLVRYTRNLPSVSQNDVIAVISSSELNGIGKGAFRACEVFSVIQNASKHDALPMALGTEYSKLSRDMLTFDIDATDVDVLCALEPAPGSTHLPEILFDEYVQGICYGAAHLLLIQPDSDWFNPQLAHEYRQWFQESIRKAYRFSVESGNTSNFVNPTRTREFF